MPDLPPYLVRTALGLVLGIVLGFSARRGGFCTLGAIEDAVYGHDTRRLRTWMLAIAVAIGGVAALEIFAGLDLSRSIYTVARLEWGGALIGGLLFGLGMALVGTCGFGTLLRFGGGDLKALMTFLVMAFTAMMTMRGVTGLARIRLTDPLTYDLPGATSQQLPDLLGLSGAGRQALAFAVAAAIGVTALASIRFLQTRRLVVTGLVIGLVIVGGWWATGIAGFDPFATRRVESFSFVAPLGPGRQDRGPIPLGSTRRRARDAAPPAGCVPDGNGRHRRARLHHRPGHLRVLDAGARLDPRDRGDFRRRADRPVSAGRAVRRVGPQAFVPRPAYAMGRGTAYNADVRLKCLAISRV